MTSPLSRRAMLYGAGAAASGILGAAAPASAASPDAPRPVLRPGPARRPRPVAPVDEEIAARFSLAYKSLPQQVVGVDVEQQITIRTADDIRAKRQGLVDYVWKGAGLPTARPAVRTGIPAPDGFTTITGVRRIDELTVPLRYGVRSRVYLLVPHGPGNGRVALYHNGHGEPLDTMVRTVQGLLDHGYTVLAFAMPFFHWNAQPIQDVDDPTKLTTITSHNGLAPWESADFSTLSFFLEPVAVALNHVTAVHRPTSVQMIGLSGGGWTTTVYPAMDPRVTRSYPTAGSWPVYLRSAPPSPKPSTGDWEQRPDLLPGFYASAGFLDMYLMAAVGPRRRQMQILNRFDACCFNGVGARSYAAAVSAHAALLAGGREERGHWELLEDATHDQHTISPYALSVILWDLESQSDEPV